MSRIASSRSPIWQTAFARQILFVNFYLHDEEGDSGAHVCAVYSLPCVCPVPIFLFSEIMRGNGFPLYGSRRQ